MSNNQKILGFIPARMAASRFPGKPLFPILGKPMIEHVYQRAKLYDRWSGLFLCTCDKEIESVARAKDWPIIMTSNKHTRALDRVAEAAQKCGLTLNDDDIILNVQGDEPMLAPEMIDAVVKPLLDNKNIPATVLAIAISDREQFINPDTVKVISNHSGEILYTSRAPIPYCKGDYSLQHGARRIGGIFGFRWRYLKEFTEMPETFLEQAESCDSNRVLDSGFRQFIAPMPTRKYFSVDSPGDIKLVEENMKLDPYFGKY